jgi:tubulin-specific chaperone D
LVERIIRALLKGLEDYTIDERGDVGSWARLACIKGLGQVVMSFLADGSLEINKWLPDPLYHEIVAGILKQGVERLNNLRVEAGKQLVALLEAPHRSGREAWVPDREGLFRELFVNVQ